MGQKNVALIIPSLRGGGAERTVSRLSNMLNDYYNLFIIVFDTENAVYSPQGNIINLDLGTADNIFARLIVFYKRIQKLKRIKRKYNIDVSISFMTGPNLVNIFSKTGDRVIISARNYITEKIYEPFIARYYQKADLIVSVSDSIREKMIDKYSLSPLKIKTIYNFINIDKIDKEAYEEIEELENEIFKKPVIISIGRLTDQKGQWHLIKAFREVKKTVGDLNLLILGEGEYRSGLEQLINGLDLTDSVFLPGFKKNPYKYLKRASLFVLTSHYEGFGNVIVEAMACSRPVISTDCLSGPGELLAPKADCGQTTQTMYAKYGILVPPIGGDLNPEDCTLNRGEKRLAGVITDVLTDENIISHYQKMSRLRALDFSREKLLNEWLGVIG